MGCISSKMGVSSPPRFDYGTAETPIHELDSTQQPTPSHDDSFHGLRRRSRQQPQIAATGLPGVHFDSQLTLQERQLIGAARWPDDAPGLNVSNKCETQANKDYCHSMWEATVKTGKSIANGRIQSFDALWKDATVWRLSRVSRDNPHYGAFATPRQEGTKFITLLRNPYQSVRPRVLHHNDAQLETFNGLLLKGIEVKTYRQQGEIFGTVIPMTVISTPTDPRHMSDQLRQLKRAYGREAVEESLKGNHPDMIEHTDVSYLPLIKHHLNALFVQALDPSLSHEQVLNLVARVHWWAASAAPDQRGSAAKAEFAARSIALAHRLELPPFRHGRVPDIEAMLMSEGEFVSQYRFMLERDPALSVS